MHIIYERPMQDQAVFTAACCPMSFNPMQARAAALPLGQDLTLAQPGLFAFSQLLGIGIGSLAFYAAARFGQAARPLRSVAAGATFMVAINAFANYRLFGTVWPYSGQQPSEPPIEQP